MIVQRCVCEIGGVEHRTRALGDGPAGSRMTADVRLTSTATPPSDTCTAPSAACSSTLYLGSSPPPCNNSFCDFSQESSFVLRLLLVIG